MTSDRTVYYCLGCGRVRLGPLPSEPNNLRFPCDCGKISWTTEPPKVSVVDYTQISPYPHVPILDEIMSSSVNGLMKPTCPSCLFPCEQDPTKPSELRCVNRACALYVERFPDYQINLNLIKGIGR